MMRLLLIGLSLGVIAITLVLSWLPSSRMSEVPWLPGPIGEWADRDPNQRTAVPLVIAGFAFTLLGERLLRLRAPFAFGMTSSMSLLGLAEFGQFFLPHRGPALGDLVWGGMGALLGAIVAVAVAWQLRRRDQEPASGEVESVE